LIDGIEQCVECNDEIEEHSWLKISICGEAELEAKWVESHHFLSAFGMFTQLPTSQIPTAIPILYLMGCTLKTIAAL
jgi:hypothetical protein